MPEVAVEKPTRMTLKHAARVDPSIGICRSCYIFFECDDRPSATYVKEDEVCAVLGCENKTCAKVSFSPYEINQK
jgi:hypothetical protein